jgi:predicted ATPase/DNA-binding CsgD family transcriptional regulator
MPLTTFVGRRGELGQLRTLFQEGNRFVTLTGIGGIGKTRLARQLGIGVAESGWAKVFVVELESISDPELVDRVVLESVGGGSNRSPLQGAVDHLQKTRALLVLDCCEHLLETVGRVVEFLLRGCPSLAILATSRSPIGIPGELVWSVPALSMQGGKDTGGGSASEAARLFADRARSADAHFFLNEKVLGEVETIVRRVDGIPLAIELAAARVRILSTSEIAAGLDNHLRLLRGARRLDSRHRTIRASLDWSHTLLTSEERRVFARLAIFSGGFDVEAATAVCGGSPITPDQMLDEIQGLVDKSLLVAEFNGGITRYRMLDFVRQYACERLDSSSEKRGLTARHLVYFRRLAERADRDLWGLDPDRRARLDDDSPNLRAAINVACMKAPEDALAIAGALALYWRVRGRVAEGSALLEQSLATASPKPSSEHALALATQSLLSFWLGNFERTFASAVAGVEMATAVGDIRSRAIALSVLGKLAILGDPASGDPMLIEGAQLARTAGDDVARCHALSALTISYFFQDNREAIRSPLDELLHVAETIGHQDNIRWYLWSSAQIDLSVGDLTRARASGERSLAMMPGEDAFPRYCAIEILSLVDALTGDPETARLRAEAELDTSIEEGIRLGTAVLIHALGVAALAGGDFDQAHQWAATLIEREPEVRYLAWHAHDILVHVALARGDTALAKFHVDALLAAAEPLRNQRANAVGYLGLSRALLLEGDEQRAEAIAHEVLKVVMERGWRLQVLDALNLLAEVAAFNGQYDRATRLIASTERERQALGLVAFPAAHQAIERLLAAAATALGEENLNKAQRDGARLSLEEAVTYAQRGRGERTSATRGWVSLSPAEQQVVELASQGQSNPEIASDLFMSRHTVKAHLAHAYIKLGVSNRTELARLATKYSQSTNEVASE